MSEPVSDAIPLSAIPHSEEDFRLFNLRLQFARLSTLSPEEYLDELFRDLELVFINQINARPTLVERAALTGDIRARIRVLYEQIVAYGESLAPIRDGDQTDDADRAADHA